MLGAAACVDSMTAALHSQLRHGIAKFLIAKVLGSL
jgi:hypothetical protein